MPSDEGALLGDGSGSVCPGLYAVSERRTPVPHQPHAAGRAVPPSRSPVLHARGFTSLGPAYSTELLCPQHQRGVLAARALWLSPVPCPGPLCAGLSCPLREKQGLFLDLQALKLTWGVS